MEPEDIRFMKEATADISGRIDAILINVDEVPTQVRTELRGIKATAQAMHDFSARYPDHRFEPDGSGNGPACTRCGKEHKP